MYHSCVLFRSILIMTITVLIFISIYSITPLLNRTPKAHAAGSMPLLQFPWPTGQAHDIDNGDTYGCGGHTGLDADAIDFHFSLDDQVTPVADGLAHAAIDRDKSGNVTGYGNYIWISHANNFVSIYAHLDKFPTGIKEGSVWKVYQGQTIIGYAGYSGHVDPPNSKGTHLHFALHSNAVDSKGVPSPWLGSAALPEPMWGTTSLSGYMGYTGFGQYGIHEPGGPNHCQSNNPSPMFVSQTPAVLSISAGISAPNSIALNQSFTTSYTVTNTGTAPFNLQSLDVVVRDPNNKQVLSLGDSNNAPISPQTSRSFSLSVPSIASRCKTCGTGIYTVSAAVLLPDGTLWNALPVTNGAQNSVQVNVIASAFTIVSSPNTSDGCNNYLVATSASSANDVWAVGHEDCGNPVMLIEHWNGTQWSIFSNPPLPARSTSTLVAVSVQSATNVWVLGSGSVPGQGSFNFVASWNGSNWTVIPTQIFPSIGGLLGIKALSANNVWVVGLYLDQNTNVWKTMIANWDGTLWTIVPSPNAGTLSGSYNSLEAVTATSATDIWAVGYYQVSSQSNPVYTLVEHWNGTKWTIVPSPTPTSSNCNSSDCTDLVSVTATSSTDAWAISHGFIEHWNGTKWTIVFTSSTANSDLIGVAASSSKEAWVAGSLYDPSQSRNLPLVEHWNGTLWNAISTPPPISIHDSAYFFGVTTLSTSTVWVVGDTSGKTLTVLYN